MIKYGYIKDYDKFVNENQKRADEYIWDFERFEEDGSKSNHIGIEFTFRTDFSNIEVVGSAKGFLLWLNQHTPQSENEII